MAIQPQNVTRLVQLLVWIGGVATTVAGAWIASKIRIYHDARKAHLEDLKERVLVPIREGLATHFSATVSQQVPLLAVQWAQVEFDERAKVTEEQTEHGEVLVAPYPVSKVFGSIHSALLEDAKKNHFSKLMASIDTFLSRWSAHLGAWHAWASTIAREILKRSGLEAFPVKGPTVRFYVMHRRLAMFVYNRLAGFAPPPLAIAEQGSAWTLTGSNTNLAFGSREQMEALIAVLDKLLETERPRTAELRSEAAAFKQEITKICSELEYAIASRRPRGRCDLVTFF